MLVMGAVMGASVNKLKSFCRICTGHCGVVATLDDRGRLTSIQGDKEDSQTQGFICSKGVDAVDSHNSDRRLLRPLKRQPDGTFTPISREQALDEIASQLAQSVEQYGPNSVAAYRGSGGFFASASLQMVNGFLEALGSHQMYSNLTIDQSAKWVAMGRLGYWPPGPQSFPTNDVAMLVGNNPLVSIAGSGFDTRNPLKRMKEAKARGMKIIVIDPRRTETAAFADVFIQPLPGNDASILAAIIRIILQEAWHDSEFCAEQVADLDALKAAVDWFTPERVAQVADIDPQSLWQAAATFARDGRRGTVASGTGPSMSPFSNLSEQLVGCLNVICGRFIRAGEPIPNPGLLLGWHPKHAQVLDIGREWERGPKSRIGGFGTVGGEMLSALLADEILMPEQAPKEGQVRCLFSIGGNPAAAVPDHHKMIRALESLDLLVSLEPYMTATSALSHYILPPRMPYERADMNLAQFETATYTTPYARYTPPLAAVPEGSELTDEWYVFWSLAARLGLQVRCNGVDLDMKNPPGDEALLAILCRNAPVSWELLSSTDKGYQHAETLCAEPPDPSTASQFKTMPADVCAEVRDLKAHCAEVIATPEDGRYPFVLSTRRSRHRFNTVGHLSPYLKRLVPYNPAYLNPADVAALGVAEGDWVEIESDHGVIRARVEADDSVRRKVVSITHCFGFLPGDDDYDTHGVSTNLLISTDRDLQTINAMPRMSGIPVAVRAAK